MRISTYQFVGMICIAIAVLTPVSDLFAGRTKVRKYRYSDVDMPVSLAVGTVRTPEFPTVSEAYFIMLQTEKPIPFNEMCCMMGLADGTDNYKLCGKEPLLQVEWIVWDDRRMVSKGSSSGWGHGKYENKNIYKFLGQFLGEKGKHYSVEVKFTRDASALSAANPHLIVIRVRYH